MNEIPNSTFFIALGAFTFAVNVDSWVSWFFEYLCFIILSNGFDGDVKEVQLAASNFVREIKNGVLPEL